MDRVKDFLLTNIQKQLSTRNRKVAGSGAIVAALGVAIYAYNQKKSRALAQQRSKQLILESKKNEASSTRRRHVAINKEFFRNLAKLLRIVIPSFKSKEVGLIALHSVFLLLRTVASVYLAYLDGRLVKSIVSGNGKEFSVDIALWLGVSVPIAFTNSMIKFLQNRISNAFRARLSRHVHDEYMSASIYYKLENLDNRIKNADQCITQDIAKFCHALADLYSNLAKPTVDCIIYNIKLAQNVGFKGLLAMTLCIHTGTFLLRSFTPSFGKLVAEEQRLEGNFRFVHSRLIANAEEIAFYGGAEVEKRGLDRTLAELLRHSKKTHWIQLMYYTLEDFVVKYYWGALGFIICALPVFSPFDTDLVRQSNMASMSSRTKDFVTNRRLLLNTSDAFGRIMYSYKEVSELAGFTARVSELLQVFEEIKAGRYSKKESSDGSQSPEFPKILGKMEHSDDIEVENLSIISPNGDQLVKGLTFKVTAGAHLLISGPNGCGKSSLFRILGGLWPVHEGIVRKPMRSAANSQMFYIPQRPYLSLGTLRDQVIYPDTTEDMSSKGLTDKNLEDILELVKLNYIVEREGGWDARNDWKDVLSGGEKQRIAMARLFYHKPRFAILDECTSAVSIDVEGMMYTKAKELGISLLTVSHRVSLWKYHDFLLEFDGSGGWNFRPINQEGGKELDNSSISKMSLEEEKKLLEKRMKDDASRVKKLVQMLGE